MKIITMPLLAALMAGTVLTSCGSMGGEPDNAGKAEKLITDMFPGAKLTGDTAPVTMPRDGELFETDLEEGSFELDGESHSFVVNTYTGRVYLWDKYEELTGLMAERTMTGLGLGPESCEVTEKWAYRVEKVWHEDESLTMNLEALPAEITDPAGYLEEQGDSLCFQVRMNYSGGKSLDSVTEDDLKALPWLKSAVISGPSGDLSWDGETRSCYGSITIQEGEPMNNELIGNINTVTYSEAGGMEPYGLEMELREVQGSAELTVHQEYFGSDGPAQSSITVQVDEDALEQVRDVLRECGFDESWNDLPRSEIFALDAPTERITVTSGDTVISFSSGDEFPEGGGGAIRGVYNVLKTYWPVEGDIEDEDLLDEGETL